MFIYLLILIIVTVVTLQAINREQYSASTIWWLMMGLGVFVGISDMLGGYDRYIYCELFDSMANVIKAEGNPWTTMTFTLYRTEPLWGAYNVLVGQFTQNRYVFIFITTMIIYVALTISILKYTNRSSLVILAFMGLWFFFTFTYLRQVLACSVAWLALDYAVKRKPLPFFAIVFLGICIHNSAAVLLPLYFIPPVQYRPGLVIIVLLLCLGLGLTPFPDALFGGYGQMAGAEDRVGTISSEAGFRYAYLMEAVVFAGLILLNYDKFEDCGKRQTLMMNMALFFCCVLLVFVRSENGGRLGWGFMIGLFSTMAYLATVKRSVTPITGTVIVMFILLYLRILMAWGILLYPYKTFFTDGHRIGDPIYEHYEYDYKYDADKFYK